MQTQYFLSRVESDLLCPHQFDLLSLTLEIYAYLQPSHDGRKLQGSIALGFPHEVLLWVSSELDLRHLWMDV